MDKKVLSVVDQHNGASYELPIEKGAIRAAALKQVKFGPVNLGLLSYDPAFLNTARARAPSPSSMGRKESSAIAAILSNNSRRSARSWKWPI